MNVYENWYTPGNALRIFLLVKVGTTFILYNKKLTSL